MPARKNPLLRNALQALALLLGVAAVTRLLRAALVDSQDFRVYFVALSAWMEGQFPYAIRAADQGFVFKYPPWTLPALVPFHWLSFEFSKAVWASLEFVAIGVSIRSLREDGVSTRVLLISTALFWYLWLAHFYAGQLTLFLLAGSLWAVKGQTRARIPHARMAAVALLLSTKVFSMFSLAGFGRRLFEPRTVAWGLGLLSAFHVALWAWTPVNGPGLLELYRGWMTAAASGGSELGAEVVRGTGNHGFAAVILRVLDPGALRIGLDLWVSIALAVTLGALWSRHSARLSFQDQWAGWLALGVAVHPLAWHHSFVLAFPLAVRALAVAEEKRKRILWITALLGIALIGLLVPQVVGKTIVKPFELVGNKSWGVLLLCWTLLKGRA